MDDNSNKEERILTKEERKKRSKERDKGTLIEQTIKDYSNREKESDNNKKDGLKRGWRTHA